MIELATAVTNYGVLVVITALAIWFVVYNYLQTGKRIQIEEEKREKRDIEQKIRDDKFNESLQMLSRSIDNQTRTLELLQQAQTKSVECATKTERTIEEHDKNIMALLMKHDDRAISIKEEIISLKANKRGKKDV